MNLIKSNNLSPIKLFFLAEDVFRKKQTKNLVISLGLIVCLKLERWNLENI